MHISTVNMSQRVTIIYVKFTKVLQIKVLASDSRRKGPVKTNFMTTQRLFLERDGGGSKRDRLTQVHQERPLNASSSTVVVD